MAKKLKDDRQILVEHIKKPSSYSMRSLDVYDDCYGISYIVSGDRAFSTPDCTYHVHGGDIGITGKGVYHRTFSLSGTPYERYGIRFSDEVIAPLLKVIGREAFEQFMSCACYHIPEDQIPEIIHLYEAMLQEYEHYTKVSGLLISGMLYRLIVLIMRKKRFVTPQNISLNIQDTQIMDVLTYLDNNYASNPSVEEMAAKAGLSPSHFMKRFKACVGSTYISYLNNYKVRLAEDLLKNTKLSLTVIAQRLGFCNTNYFSAVFKKENGMSPLEYRRKNS